MPSVSQKRAQGKDKHGGHSSHGAAPDLPNVLSRSGTLSKDEPPESPKLGGARLKAERRAKGRAMGGWMPESWRESVYNLKDDINSP